MASKRRRRRTQCGDKQRLDRGAAMAVRASLLRVGRKLDAYRCGFCGTWHVGHRPAWVDRRIEMRRS